MDGVQLAAGPSPVVSDAGAAFGVYPGMGKRSQKSTIGERMITGAPDFGAGALREGTAAALGFGGDMQKIGRFIGALATDNQGGTFMDKVNRAGKTMQDPTFLPSSEEVSKEGFTIPGTDITIQLPPAVPPGTSALGLTPEERQAAAEAGGTVGELVGDPLLAAKAGTMAVKGAMAAGKALAPTAGKMALETMEKLGTPVQMNIVPPSPSTVSAATKAMAPASNIGFYSAVEKAALNVQRNSGSGQAFLNDITKGENVKLDEIKWMGLDDFLKGKKNVTKQEVQDFVQNNRVDVQERELSGTGDKSRVFSEFNSAVDKFVVYGKDSSIQGAFNTAEEADNFVKQFNSQIPYGPTTYDKYQLPGGENYREILLTLPFKEPAMPKGYEVTSMQYDDGTVRYFANTPTTRSQGFRTQEEAQAELSKTASNLKDFRESLVSYQSSHFDEPNVLAHMRVNDRVDADGKKMLLIEEVQSDWHQAGREKGYKGKGTLTELPNNYFVQELKTIDGDTIYVVRDKENPGVVLNRDYNKQSAINGVINELNATSAGGVPDAPFKDTWYQLALKRALRYAADNGYDRVGLTTGKQQAERYDLAKQINELSYKKIEDDLTLSLGDGPYYEVSAIDKNNSPVLKKQVTEKELPNLVGKEMAKKIINGEGSGYPDGSISSGSKVFTGIDLQVGGEGMKKYYDDVYPKFLEKYGKKWGASVGETQIKTGRGVPGGEPVRYIDITPEMRKSVQKGQPLAAVSGEETVA
jgi:hypothetical protein